MASRNSEVALSTLVDALAEGARVCLFFFVPIFFYNKFALATLLSTRAPAGTCRVAQRVEIALVLAGECDVC